ncbi:MAG: hypothetical protein M0T79_11415 [Actinomycetota bacterium]|jgi:hypothetical protein|nr:hypothetical protein [Actinomycetota bacterium]
MSRRASLLLRASVIWTFWVWVVLVRNMIVGNFAGSFKLVHIALAVVSLAFAVVTWHITSTSRRFTREVERERRPRGERMSPAQLALGVVRLGMRKRTGRGSPEPAAQVDQVQVDQVQVDQAQLPVPAPGLSPD